jgi:hypothetical protein
MKTTIILVAAMAVSLVSVTDARAQARGMSAHLIPIAKKNDRGKGIMNAVAMAEKRGAMPWGLTQRANQYFLMAIKGMPKIRYSGSVITTLHLNNRRQVQQKLDGLANKSQLPIGMVKWGRGKGERAAVLALQLKGKDKRVLKSIRLVPCPTKGINKCLKSKLSYLKQGYIPTAVTRVKNTVWMLMAKAPKWARAINGWSIRTTRASFQSLRKLANSEARAGRLPVGILFYSRSQAATFVVGLKR